MSLKEANRLSILLKASEELGLSVRQTKRIRNGLAGVAFCQM